MFIYLFLIVISSYLRTPPNTLIKYNLSYILDEYNDINNNNNTLFLNELYSDKLNRKGIPLDYYSNFSILEGNITDYQLKKQIGRGKYSKVFKGKNIKNGNDVIIKVLKPSKYINN
jgi:hypothetical protein